MRDIQEIGLYSSSTGYANVNKKLKQVYSDVTRESTFSDNLNIDFIYYVTGC